LLQVADLKVRYSPDGADKYGLLEMYRNPTIQGFTTNHTLMTRRRGSPIDEDFAIRHSAGRFPTSPISFQSLSDEMEEMEEQAHT